MQKTTAMDTNNSQNPPNFRMRDLDGVHRLLDFAKALFQESCAEVKDYCDEKCVKYKDIRPAIKRRFDWNEDIISAEPFEPNSRVVVMSCCHYFMRDQLEKWFISKGKFECPVCRRCDEYIKE